MLGNGQTRSITNAYEDILIPMESVMTKSPGLSLIEDTRAGGVRFWGPLSLMQIEGT